MAAGVRVDGLRQTVRNLERLGVQISDLKSAFNRIGNIVVREAVSLTPRLSGRLAGSIRAGKAKNKSEIRAGGARIPYAGVIHYGGYNNITAQPFLTTAAQNKQGQVVREVENELQALLRRYGR